nr:hypothetical protein [Tanacetum cinerariifolium]GFB63053.1 hypothetical protein [Tanacetum cinerariifolium]
LIPLRELWSLEFNWRLQQTMKWQKGAGSLIRCSLLSSRLSFSERQGLMRQTSPRVQDVKGDMDSIEFSRYVKFG